MIPSTGYVSVFADDFNGSVAPDFNHSTWDTALSGGVRYAMADDRALYIDRDFVGTNGSIIPLSSFSYANGALNISAIKTPSSYLATADNRPYLSGAISTWQHQQFKYGYFEASIELPGGKGTHPAFWLRTTDPSQQVEIDILESVGGDNFRPYQTVHGPEGTFKVGRTTQAFDMSKGFHKYAVDWQPDYITTYVDGVQTGKIVTPESLKGVPMYLIANVAMGTNWAGQPDATTTWPQTMKIDYIHAFQNAASFVAVDKTGTMNAEHFFGNDGADVINGGGGNDTIFGAGGNDKLTGGDGNDRIFGGMGNDTIDGRLGTDYLAGGLGDDTYVVNSTGKTFYETATSGHDTLQTNLATYALTGYLEDLTYTGTTAFKGTGNNFANLIRGGSGNDTLVGNSGNDTLDGGNGNDRFDGGVGADVIRTGHGQDFIVSFQADDKIDVSAWGFTLLGQVTAGATKNAAGQLVLHLGSDSITLAGYTSATQVNSGDFVFAGGSTAPVVNQAAPTEAASTSTSNTGVESATGTGLKLVGTAQAELLTGTLGNDTIQGGNGNDVIVSNSGNDLVYGGPGNDRFVFKSTETGTDKVMDWNVGDKIDLTDFHTSLATLAMHDTTAGLQIDLGAEHVVVNGAHSLGASDFFV